MDGFDQHERLLLTDIDELRNRFPNTQDLYREVCALMFFRYGLTPTANKLYQLVRKGSMSAPAEALNRFWENLREKSRVSISHPDLPDSLRDAAGEVIAKLWVTAQTEAEKSFASLKDDFFAKLNEAAESVRLANNDREIAQNELEILSAELSQQKIKADELRHEITSLESKKSVIEKHSVSLKEDLDTSLLRLDDARRELSLEIQKMRESSKLAEERLAANEKRTLLEIDRERTLSTRTQKALELAQSELKIASDFHRGELAEQQKQIVTFVQKIGSLEGTIMAANEKQINSNLEISDLRVRLTAAQDEGLILLKELENFRTKSTKKLKSNEDSATTSKFIDKRRSKTAEK